MAELVERMLDPSASSGQALHKQLPKAKTPHGQNEGQSPHFGELQDILASSARRFDIPARAS